MKLRKGLFSAATAAALILGTSLPAFAATNSDVITALNNTGAAQSYVSEAQTYLNQHSVSAATLDTVVSNINAAAPKIKAAGGDLSKLSAADKASVKSNILAAASALGLTANFEGGNKVVLKDSTGATVFSTDSSQPTGTSMAQTATNYGNLIAIGAFLIVAAAGSTVLMKKKSLA
ncbi:hypothetical protein IAI10_16845 [Clostridium sp. 19966]|uniref:hypothetical protein n=1 Tax=Clostridium sp. 19966 TaxID=2768166 RepID=UPI0028E03158|nr:hypothetical protein [Clostridium sp. 19966]MDT8718336.1 hypothetical protein [Clostridium sp. 19966]